MTGAPFFHIHGFARVLDSNPGDRKVSFSFRLNKETKLDVDTIWPSGDKVQLPQAGDLVEVDAAAIGHTATRVSWRIPNYRRAIVLKAPVLGEGLDIREPSFWAAGVVCEKSFTPKGFAICGEQFVTRKGEQFKIRVDVPDWYTPCLPLPDVGQFVSVHGVIIGREGDHFLAHLDDTVYAPTAVTPTTPSTIRVQQTPRTPATPTTPSTIRGQQTPRTPATPTTPNTIRGQQTPRTPTIHAPAPPERGLRRPSGNASTGVDEQQNADDDEAEFASFDDLGTLDFTILDATLQSSISTPRVGGPKRHVCYCDSKKCYFPPDQHEPLGEDELEDDEIDDLGKEKRRRLQLEEDEKDGKGKKKRTR